MTDTVVDIPGVGQVAFPPSMSDADITAAIKTKIMPQAEPDSIGKKAMSVAESAFRAGKSVNDYLVTQGTKVASGLLGAPSDLGQLGAEGMHYLFEKALGPSSETKRKLQADQMQEPWSTARPDEPKRNIIPGSADINKLVFGKLGVPDVNLGDNPALTIHPGGSNINLGKMADAGVQGAMSMVAGPGGIANFTRNALPGAIAGVTSESAGQATKGSNWEIPARIAGAVAGGGATMLGQGVADRMGGMLAPWTQPGKERLAQDIVGGVATDPRKAASVLDNYAGDAVPGVNQTAPKVSADPGLLSLENYVQGAAGSNSRLQGMTEANNVARTAHLQSLEAGDIGNFVNRVRQTDAGLAAQVDQALASLPPSTTPTQAGMLIRQTLENHRDALTAQRRTATQPLYDEVAAWTAPVDARNARATAEGLVNSTKDELQNTATSARNTLYNRQGQPDNTASGLVAARQAMANRLSKESTSPAEGRILTRVQGATDQALEDAVPAARLAREEYERRSVPLEPFTRDRGPSVFNVLSERRPVDPAMIPQTFLRSGQQGVAGVRDLTATGAPNVTAPLPGYVAGIVRDNPAAAGRFAGNFGPGMAELDPTLMPGSLGARVGNVAAAQEGQAAFRATPSGRMATGADANKEIGTVLAAKDGRTQIGNMVMQAGNDETALRGIRQGIIDDFKTTIESRGGTDAAGNQTLLSAKAKAWVDNKMQAANGALTPEQQQGIRALVDSLDVQSRTAPKMAGSDTVRNAMSGTFMGRILDGGLANIPGVSTLLKTAKTKEDVLRIVADTLADPEGAKVMLMKFSDANAKIADPILSRLAKSQPALLPQETGQ